MSEYWQGFVTAVPVAAGMGAFIGRRLLLAKVRAMMDIVIEMQRRLIEHQAKFFEQQQRAHESVDDLIKRMERP